jgi:tRNA pseudouridine32 synthase / 23S rRNA pseudouridine746 synthase
MSAPEWAQLRRETCVFADDDVLALNKPVGISVMGERHDTDLTQIAKEAGEQLYPVHRIDKVTSGIVLFARNLDVHGGLTRQFNKRTATKTYLVITRTADLPIEAVIDLPLSAGRKGRVRIAAPREAIKYDGGAARWHVPQSDLLDTKMYPSLTEFTTAWSDGEHSLLVVRPITGRRHQIRVHLAWIGHPILGDPLFDKTSAAQGRRTHLHSWRLGLEAPWRPGGWLRLRAEPGADFWQPVVASLAADRREAVLSDIARD